MDASIYGHGNACVHVDLGNLYNRDVHYMQYNNEQGNHAQVWELLGKNLTEYRTHIVQIPSSLHIFFQSKPRRNNFATNEKVY